MRDAVIAAINDSQLFKHATTNPSSEYELAIQLLKSEDVAFFGGHYKIVARWTLRKSGAKDYLFDDFIEGNGESHAFAGVKRTRTALEAAVQDHIRQGVERLSKVKM